MQKSFEIGTLPSLEELARLLGEAGAALELGLPPKLPPGASPDTELEAWEQAAEDALQSIERLERARAAARDAHQRRARIEEVTRALSELDAQTDARAPRDDALAAALFVAAVDAREAWAAAQAERLRTVVDDVLEAVQRDASLRAVWRSSRWSDLSALFGVWGCTLLSLGNCFPAEGEEIDRLIIDEAGQCHPAYAVSGLLRARSALVLGDVHQLEPVIDLEPDDDERVLKASKLSLDPAVLAAYRVHAASRTSVQSVADRASAARPSLSDHFRCQPEIIAISDALCGYGLRVHTPRQEPRPPLPFLPDPVGIVDVTGEQTRLGGSWKNADELELALTLCQAIIRAGLDPSDLAIITPYRGQLEELRRALRRAGVGVEPSSELFDLEDAPQGSGRGVALGTVHRFQGGERSVVLFSTVVTRRSSLGFLDDRENLLNVAVSRARHRLVVLGHRALLAEGRRTRLLVEGSASVDPTSFALHRTRVSLLR